MYKISVIIPVYNVENYLDKCLSSVINQTYKNLEIICINDCSTDNSLDILKLYAEEDKRIKIIDRKTNGGLSVARNSGLEVATGDYVYFIDSDDYIDNNYLEKMLEIAIENNVDVVLNTNIIAHKGNLEFSHLADKTYSNVVDSFIDAKKAILNIVWNTWAHLWNKSFLDEISAKFPEGCIIEDQYFQAITYIHLDKIYVTKAGTYHYTIRDTSIMGKLNNNVFYAHLKILNKIFDYYMEKNLQDKLQNVRLITNSLFPQNSQDKYNQFIALRKYFSRIKKYVNNSRIIYFKSELALFDDTLSDIDKAMETEYTNLYIMDKLRQNIKLQEGNSI